MLRIVLVLLLGAASGAAPRQAQAQPDAYVDAGADGAATGESWADAYRSLHTAVAEAQSGDEIWVADGVYRPDEGPGISSGTTDTSFVVDTPVSVYGGFEGGETQRSARDPQAHPTVLSGDVDGDDATTASGVTPTASDQQGSNSRHVVRLRSQTARTRIDGVVVTAGAGGSGGGIRIRASSPLLRQVRVVGNAGSNGGGIYVTEGDAAPVFANVTVAGNSAGSGGGLYFDLGTADARLVNAVIRGNRAGSFGGGVYDASGNNRDGNPVINVSTFAGNRAVNSAGGGLFAYYNTRLAIRNCVFSGNASGYGGAQLDKWSSGEALQLRSSLVESLSLPEDPDFGSYHGIDTTDVIVARAAFAAPIDPPTAPTAAGDVHLQDTSPGLDAGSATLLPLDRADLDGDGVTDEVLPRDRDAEPRVQDAGVDVGAYEGAASAAVPPAPSGLTATPEPGSVALSWEATARDDLAGYHVYRSASAFADLADATRLTASPHPETTYQDASVEPETSYHYRVTAVTTGGTESLPSASVEATPAPVVTPPTGVEATAGNQQVDVSWTEVATASAYRVYRDTAPIDSARGPSSYEAVRRVASGTDFTDTEVDNGTTYHYRVTAVADDGTESGFSTEQTATPSFGWPQPTRDPSLVFKIVSSGGVEVDRVDLVWVTDQGAFQDLSKTVSDQGFVVFDSSDLEKAIVDQGLGGLREIELRGSEGDLLGHQEFRYDRDFYDRGKSLDALLHVHGEDRLQPDRDDGDGPLVEWGYYADGEHPVSMLIPPNRHIEAVGGASPVMMVHGLSGIYPYWGYDPFGETPTGDRHLVADLSASFDTWRFYYPKNQDVTKSSPLLAKALWRLRRDYYGTDQPIDVVAHSMGGLVVRHYLQSSKDRSRIGDERRPYPKPLRYTRRQNVGRFLMMGTPNHGALSAYRADEWVSRFGGKDPEAPAYQQLTPGSSFLKHLNAPLDPSRSLSAGDLYGASETLVLAGTRNPISLLHTEIPRQDDGFVAVSSAALFAFDIPLALGDYTHSGAPDLSGDYDPRLTTGTGEIVRAFLEASGALSTPLPDDITGYWSAAKEKQVFTSDTFNPDDGMHVVDVEGDPEFLGLSVQCAQSANPDACQDPRPTLTIGSTGGMARTPGTSTFFSARNGLGHGLEAGKQAVYLKKKTSVRLRPFGQTTLRFRHLQTERESLSLDPGQRTVAASNAIAPVVDTESSASTSATASTATASTATAKASGTKVSQFYVDAATDSLTFWLARDTTGPFDGSSFRLERPDGTRLDADDATSRSRLSFTRSDEAGYALYFVDDPQTGRWTTRHDVASASVVAPVRSALDLTVSTPDTTVPTGTSVPVAVTVSDANTYRQVDVDGRVRVTGPDGDRVNLGAVQLSRTSDTSYETTITPAYPGTYQVSIAFSATVDGDPVLRQATGRVRVAGDSTETVPAPPSAPSSVRSAVRGNRSVLTWTSEGEAPAGYVVYRDTIPSPLRRVARLPGTATQFADSTVVRGPTYRYRVTAVGETGSESRTAARTAVTPDSLSRIAVATRAVGSQERIDFGSTGIAVTGAGGSGRLVVSRHDDAPAGTLATGDRVVGDARFVIDAERSVDLNGKTRLRVDAESVRGLEKPGQTALYRRETGSQPYRKQETTYDAEAGALHTSLEGEGSYVLARTPGPDPVEVHRLEAQPGGEGVTLTWRTGRTAEAIDFALQRRDESNTWARVGVVPGTDTTAADTYRYTDDGVPYEADSLVYRLRQINPDGRVTTLDEVAVTRAGVERLTLLPTYPNPATHQVTVRYAIPTRTTVRLRLYDILGRRVRSVVATPQAGRKEVDLDVSGLASGVYVLRLSTDQTTQTRKLTIVQ